MSSRKKYSQLERERLGIIFRVKKFHQTEYIYEHPVTIEDDHKPLVGLFREDRSVLTMAASPKKRQRLALTLATYEYTIIYRTASDNGNTDAGDTVLLMDHLENTYVNDQMTEKWTRKDTLLATLKRYVMNGWSINMSK